MEYATILLIIAMALVFVVQGLKLVLKSESYRRRSFSLTLGIAAFFLPISVSIFLISSGVDEGGVNFLVAFCGIGSLVALFFFAKAALHS